MSMRLQVKIGPKCREIAFLKSFNITSLIMSVLIDV